MTKFRRYFFFVLIVTLMTALSAYADGNCTINWIEQSGSTGWAMVDYYCGGDFVGTVEAELHVEYAPMTYSKVTMASAGDVYATYQAPNVPSYDALYTVAPVFPGYLSRAVATIRWETSEFQCWGWGWWTCGRMWASQTVYSDWQSPE